MGNFSRQQLLQYIDEVSFALIEIGLYLDTHPRDEIAIRWFNKYSDERCNALKLYAQKFEPITMNCANYNSVYEWATTKWPWEGEC